MKEILNSKQIERFIREGFVRIDNAFERGIAEEARAILWKDMDARFDDPSTWTRPVVRLGWYSFTCVIRSSFTPPSHTVVKSRGSSPSRHWS